MPEAISAPSPFLQRNGGRLYLLAVHGRGPWNGARPRRWAQIVAALAQQGCCEPAQQRSGHIEGMLDIHFAIGDISGAALRHEGGQKAAGDAKFYVGGHWIYGTLSVKRPHIEALRRRLARDGICAASQILKLPLNA